MNIISLDQLVEIGNFNVKYLNLKDNTEILYKDTQVGFIKFVIENEYIVINSLGIEMGYPKLPILIYLINTLFNSNSEVKFIIIYPMAIRYLKQLLFVQLQENHELDIKYNGYFIKYRDSWSEYMKVFIKYLADKLSDENNK